MNNSIISKLNDLILQATEERSHCYVKSVCEEAKREIMELRLRLRSSGEPVRWK